MKTFFMFYYSFFSYLVSLGRKWLWMTAVGQRELFVPNDIVPGKLAILPNDTVKEGKEK